MARFLLFLLGVVALAAGAADAYLGGAEHEKIVDRHATDLLAASSRSLPLALGADEDLRIVREVAQRTPFQFTLADFALQGAAPDADLLERAERAVAPLSEGKEPVVIVGTRGGVLGVRGGDSVELGEGARELVQRALAGNEAQGLVSIENRLFRLRAVPVATGALAVALRVDDAFAKTIGASLGSDVTFIHRGKAVASTLETMERAELAVASTEGAELFGAGARPGAYRVFEVLELPLFTPWAGTMRALASESGEATVIHSTSIRPLLDPLVELQKRSLLLSALVAVVAFFFALVVGGGSRQLRKLVQIVDVAERIAEGDDKAHAPEHLAGDLGRLSRALNRLASQARREDPVKAALATGEDFESGSEESVADLAASFTFPSEPSSIASEGPAMPPPLPLQEPGAPTAEAEPAADAEASAAGLAFLSESEPSGMGQVALPAEEEPRFGESEPSAASPAEPPLGFSTFEEPGPSEAESTETFEASPPEGFESSPLGAAAQEEPSTGFTMGPPADDEPEAPAHDASEAWDAPTRPLPFLTQQESEPEPPQPFEAPAPAAPEPLPAAPALQAVPPAAPAPVEASEPVDPEEAHLREVYKEFLRVREECGESSAGISYERFSARLRQNRAQLIEKYRCETVRFTVYVKDGRAALKASPIGVNRAS